MKRYCYYDMEKKKFIPASKARRVEVKGFDGFDLFMCSCPDQQGYDIREACSGSRIVQARSQEEAMTKCVSLLDARGIDELHAAIISTCQKHGTCPGFRPPKRPTMNKKSAVRRLTPGGSTGTDKKVLRQHSMIVVKLDEIHPHPANPRVHNEENIAAIMQSYREFGELGPLVIWGDENYIISGNGRFEAAKRLGMDSVQAIRADHLSEQQAKAFLIADNKTCDLSHFDDDQLSVMLADLRAEKYDVFNTGLSRGEIEAFLPNHHPDVIVGDVISDLKGETVRFSADQWRVLLPILKKAMASGLGRDLSEAVISLCKKYSTSHKTLPPRRKA